MRVAKNDGQFQSLDRTEPGKDAPQSSFLNALIKVVGVLIFP